MRIRPYRFTTSSPAFAVYPEGDVVEVSLLYVILST